MSQEMFIEDEAGREALATNSDESKKTVIAALKAAIFRMMARISDAEPSKYIPQSAQAQERERQLKRLNKKLEILNGR